MRCPSSGDDIASCLQGETGHRVHQSKAGREQASVTRRAPAWPLSSEETLPETETWRGGADLWGGAEPRKFPLLVLPPC